MWCVGMTSTRLDGSCASMLSHVTRSSCVSACIANGSSSLCIPARFPATRPIYTRFRGCSRRMADDGSEQEMRDLFFGKPSPFLDEHRSSMRELIEGFHAMEDIMFYSCNVNVPTESRMSMSDSQRSEKLTRLGHKDFPSIKRSVQAFLREQLAHWTALGEERPAGDPTDRLVDEMVELDQEVSASFQQEWQAMHDKKADITRRLSSSRDKGFELALKSSNIFISKRMHWIEKYLKRTGHVNDGKGWHSESSSNDSLSDDVVELKNKLAIILAFTKELAQDYYSGGFPGLDGQAAVRLLGVWKQKVVDLELKIAELEKGAGQNAEMARDMEVFERFDERVTEISQDGDNRSEDGNLRIFYFPPKIVEELRVVDVGVLEMLETPLQDLQEGAVEELIRDVEQVRHEMTEIPDAPAPDMQAWDAMLEEVTHMLENLKNKHDLAARLRALRAHPALYKAWVRESAGACTGTRSTRACSARGSTAGCATSRSRRASCSSS